MKPGGWAAMVALSSLAVVQVNVSRLRGSMPPFVSVWFTPDVQRNSTVVSSLLLFAAGESARTLNRIVPQPLYGRVLSNRNLIHYAPVLPA